MRYFLAALLCIPAAFAQKQELGLTLGHIFSDGRTTNSVPLDLSSGIALQANYAFRLYEGNAFSAYFETHFLANGQRQISSSNSRVTRDVATAYVTPGIRVKFFPKILFSLT